MWAAPKRALERALAIVHAVQDGVERRTTPAWQRACRIAAASGSNRVSYAFNSFFRLVRKRQSVPCAMILFGVDLSIPASRKRKA